MGELRAARDLAQVWAERGERHKAYDLLAPIYGWFTEGFDTPILTRIRRMTEQFDVMLRRIMYNYQQVNLSRVEPSWRTRRVN